MSKCTHCNGSGYGGDNCGCSRCGGTGRINGFVDEFNIIQNDAHCNAINKGFYDNTPECNAPTELENIAKMHCELSEALSALSHGNPMSDKIPEFTQAEEEYADVIIRIMDNAQWEGHRIAEAIIAKMQYNKSRPYKHGKKF